MRILRFIKTANVTPTLLLAAVALPAQSSVPRSNQWALNNGMVSRVLAFDARHGLITTSWKNLDDGKEFIDSQQETMDGYCREFRFSLNDREYTGTPEQFALAHAEQSADATGARHLALSMISRDGMVAVTVQYTLPAGSTGIRQFLSIRNQSGKPLTLSHVSIACEPLAPAQPDNLLAYGGYGEQPREIFFTGRLDDVAILLENGTTGDGVAVLSEVPGVLKRTEVGVIGKWHQWEPGVNVMYDTDLFPFERTLAPGETFTTAAVSFVLYQRGTRRTRTGSYRNMCSQTLLAQGRNPAGCTTTGSRSKPKSAPPDSWRSNATLRAAASASLLSMTAGKRCAAITPSTPRCFPTGSPP